MVSRLNNYSVILRLIITKSPVSSREAMTAIRALNADSPIIQTRLNRVVELALIDPDCYLTPNERELIASLVEVEAEQDTNRTKNLMIRLTEIEHQELQFLADEAGKTMSDYVRSKIF